jgi:hypothetical protein
VEVSYANAAKANGAPHYRSCGSRVSESIQSQGVFDVGCRQSRSRSSPRADVL